MFTMVLGMLCNSNFWFYLRTFRYSEGSAGSLPPVTFLNGHHIRLTFCRPCSWFCIPATEHLGSWSRVCTKSIINITHWFHHQFSITTSTYSYMEACGMECMLVHIFRYMSQMSNNNKMLTNNSLCYFAIQVVYIQIIIT